MIKQFHTVLLVVLLSFGWNSGIYAQKSLTWTGCGITKKAFGDELAAAYEKKTGIKINLDGGGATLGIRGVNKGSLDIGGACRYTLQGDDEANVIMKPVAWDALAVITNATNPVDNITIEQIRGIFTGKIRNWSELGGPNKTIEVYIRDGKISGVGWSVRTLVFDDTNIDFYHTKSFKSTGPLERAIETDPFSIGFTGISSARKRNVKIMKLEGKEPSFENIQNGSYLLYRPLYLAINASESRQEVMNFIKFAHSLQGREILRRNGTVPYLDALHLVLKQVDQHKLARDYMSSN